MYWFALALTWKNFINSVYKTVVLTKILCKLPKGKRNPNCGVQVPPSGILFHSTHKMPNMDAVVCYELGFYFISHRPLPQRTKKEPRTWVPFSLGKGLKHMALEAVPPCAAFSSLWVLMLWEPLTFAQYQTTGSKLFLPSTSSDCVTCHFANVHWGTGKHTQTRYFTSTLKSKYAKGNINFFFFCWDPARSPFHHAVDQSRLACTFLALPTFSL